MQVAFSNDRPSAPILGRRAGWQHWPTSPLGSPAAASAAGLVIALCLFGLAMISYARAYLDGTLASDGSHVRGWPYAVIVTIVSICCMTSGYLFIRACRTKRHPSLERLLLIALAIQGCAFPAMPLSGDDVFVNMANGRLLQCGLNPYKHTPADLGVDEFNALVSPIWFRWISPYGPINVWVSRAAVSAGGLWASIWTFKSLMLLCAVALVLLAYGFCRTCVPAQRRAGSFVLLAWNPLLAWELSGQAHNDGPMLVCTMAFVWAALSRREWLASGLLIAAFYAKLAMAPLLGLFLCCRTWQSWWRGALTAVAVGAAGVALYYPFWYGPDTLTTTLVEARSANWHIINSLVSVACDIAGWFSPAARLGVFNAWSISYRCAFLALAAFYAWRANSPQRVIRDALMFLLLFELLGKGWYFPWYANWLLPLAVADEDERLQFIVASYSMLVELLYIPANIFIPLAHGLVLVMLCRYLLSQRSAATGDGSGLEPAPAIDLLPSSAAA